MMTTNAINYSSATDDTNQTASQCSGLTCYSLTLLSILSSLTILTAVFGVVTNILSMASIVHSRLHQNINCQLILCLGLANLLYMSLVLPFQAISFRYHFWVLPDWMCSVLAFIRFWMTGANMTFLSAIALYRLLSITNPVDIHNRNLFYATVSFAWIIPFLIAVAPVTGVWGSYAFEERLLQCTINSKAPDRSHALFMITIGYFLPAIFIIGFYSYIGYAVYRARKIAFLAGPRVWNNQKRLLSVHMNMMMVVIFLNFFAGATPFFIMNLIDPTYTMPRAHVLTSCFAWVSYCVNPFIYTTMDKGYMEAFLQVLFCLNKHSPLSSTVESC